MEGSASKSVTHRKPPVIKIEDDDVALDEKRDAGCNKPTDETPGKPTVPVKASSTTMKSLNTAGAKNVSKAPASVVAKAETNATESKDKAAIKQKGMGHRDGNETTCSDAFDAIADIASKAHVRSKRRKRARFDKGTDAFINDCSRSQVTSNASASTLMAMSCHPPTVVTASISNHYVPPRLISGTGLAKQNGSTKNKDYSSRLDSHSSGNKNKVSVHMLNSVGLECGDDGVLQLEHFDDDEEIPSTHADDTDGDKAAAIKAENNAGGDENCDTSNNMLAVTKNKPPQWSLEQHKAFAAAIFEIGLKNCSPSVIMENMRKQPRYITRERTKSHLQKYRQTKERSRAEFLKEYDVFFKSIEQAKAHLNRKNCISPSSDEKEPSACSDTKGNNVNHKEPIPKAVLTTALEGKKPNKLLGGKAAALLSYSVLNNFSTSHGPDQLQYKAAKLMEFPIMSEEEKRSSVGASLLQVKSLIDNMTDALLKQRHGISPIPAHKTGNGDEESDSSSSCSSEDGYSEDEEDNVEGNAANNKQQINKALSKDQDPATAAVPTQQTGPFATATAAPGHPFYRGPTTAYPPPYPAPVAPASVGTGFALPYPHAPPSFYGGAPPPPHLQAAAAPPPAFGAPVAFAAHPMHYTQDARINPYQQAPPGQVGAYPGVPPIQPNYYPGVAGYPAYYGNTGEGGMAPTVNGSNPSTEYNRPPPQPSYPQQTGSSQQHQQQRVYDQSPSHSNEGRGERRTFDLSGASPTDASNQRRSERRSKRRRTRDHHSENRSVDTRNMPRKSRDDFRDFLDRLSRMPSPDKAPQRTSSSPVQRSSRGHEKFKSSPSSMHPDDALPKTSERQSRHHGQQYERQHYDRQFESSGQSKSYAKDFESPAGDPFSESEASRFASPYEASPIDNALNERQSQGHVSQDQQQQQLKQNDINGQFWESSNFMGTEYNDQQQQNAGGGDFHQQPAQPDVFVPVTHNRRYGNSLSSPEGEATGNFFFGE